MPVDVTKTQARWGEPTDFHIVGSDASGHRLRGGRRRSPSVTVGDRVVVHAGQWDPGRPVGEGGQGPGPGGELPRVGLRHVLGLVRAVREGPGASVPAEGGLPHVGGGRRAHAHRRHRLPDAVRVAARTPWSPATSCWSGAARAGSARSRSSWSRAPAAGPVAVVSSDEKGEYCKSLGAVGFINRKHFSHWGVPPAWDTPEWKDWFAGAKAFGKAIWDVLGEKTSPRIVFEHPGAGHDPHLDLRGGSRRHGRDLRRHHRVRHDRGRALPLVPAEAVSGIAPVQRRAG